MSPIGPILSAPAMAWDIAEGALEGIQSGFAALLHAAQGAYRDETSTESGEPVEAMDPEALRESILERLKEILANVGGDGDSITVRCNGAGGDISVYDGLLCGNAEDAIEQDARLLDQIQQLAAILAERGEELELAVQASA